MLGASSLNHWTTRDAPAVLLKGVGRVVLDGFNKVKDLFLNVDLEPCVDE